MPSEEPGIVPVVSAKKVRAAPSALVAFSRSPLFPSAHLLPHSSHLGGGAEEVGETGGGTWFLPRLQQAPFFIFLDFLKATFPPASVQVPFRCMISFFGGTEASDWSTLGLPVTSSTTTPLHYRCAHTPFSTSAGSHLSACCFLCLCRNSAQLRGR